MCTRSGSCVPLSSFPLLPPGSCLRSLCRCPCVCVLSCPSFVLPSFTVPAAPDPWCFLVFCLASPCLCCFSRALCPRFGVSVPSPVLNLVLSFGCYSVTSVLGGSPSPLLFLLFCLFAPCLVLVLCLSWSGLSCFAVGPLVLWGGLVCFGE